MRGRCEEGDALGFSTKFVVYLHRPPFFYRDTETSSSVTSSEETTATGQLTTLSRKKKNGGTFQELKCHSITNKLLENAECSTIHGDVCASPA